MNLHKNSQLFKEVINEVAYEKKIDVSIVEKDYYVTYFLKELLKLDSNYIFKGGTSLSKAYHIINRFSEDIDLNYPFHLLTTGRRKKIKNDIISIIESSNLLLLNFDEIRSRRTFNQYRIDYFSIYSEDKWLKPILVVETAFQTEAYPVEIFSIQSMIAEFFEEKGYSNYISQYDLYPFDVKVQSKERTLVDKVFAIGDYYLENKSKEHSRHLYDISMLLRVVELNEQLINLFLKVREDRGRNSYCKSAQSQIVLSDLLIEILNRKYYKEDYINITEAFCFEIVDYEVVVNSLLRLIDFLKGYNL